MTDYPTLLRILAMEGVHVDDSQVQLAVRVGSHVYGTATAESDEDFAVVLTKGHRDLVRRTGVNVVVHTSETFQAALGEQNIFALEMVFAPLQHRLKMDHKFYWWLDGPKVRASAIEKSVSDYNKAVKGPSMDDKAKKRLWHSLRVPVFAVQVQRAGAIVDFTAANSFYEDIMTDPRTAASHYAQVWGPVRDRILREL
jgi:hypothetical protein